LSIADTLGRYRLAAPEPGTYRIVAERLGYEPYRTPLLRADSPDGVYAIELLMARAPLPVLGITVTTERREQIFRSVQLIVGVDPRSLRTAPIGRAQIHDHLQRGHNLTDLVRWSGTPIVVRQTTGGPCFQYRARGCMGVRLNGVPVSPDFVDTLPLDMIETIVILGPNESIAYGASVLLYTAGWLR